MKKEEFVRKTKYLALSFKLLGSKIRHFNLTKHLLEKEERNLQTSIMLKEGSIEHWRQQTLFYENSILVNKNLTIQAEKEIKELEKDVKKVVKVINMYIKD